MTNLFASSDVRIAMDYLLSISDEKWLIANALKIENLPAGRQGCKLVIEATGRSV